MRKNISWILLFVLSFSLLLPGCSVTVPSDYATVPSDETFPTIPVIEKFGATAYEQYEFVFPPVESAVLVHNGTQVTIEPTDPRLIRLLNSLCYSYHNDYTLIRQGIVEESEINMYLGYDVPMLDIKLSQHKLPEKSHEITRAYRVVICANSCLLFIDPQQTTVLEPEKMYAYQHWPYFDVLIAPYETNSKESDAIWDSYWGENLWIDLLQYAGFYAENSKTD